MTYTQSDRPRQTRGKGSYSLRLLGEEIHVRTLPKAVETTLLKIESAKPGFLEKLRLTGRRIVGRKPEDIHPNDPDLREKYAYELKPGWYYNANIDCIRCYRYLEIIASVAGIETPQLKDHSTGMYATRRGWE